MNPMPLDPGLAGVMTLCSPLFHLACAIAVVARFRGSTSAVFGGIAFGVLALLDSLPTLLGEWGAMVWFENRLLLLVFHVAALAGLLVMLLTVPARSARAAETAPASAGSAHARRRPGSGLSITWSVLSGVGLVVGLAFLAAIIEAGRHISRSEMEYIAPLGMGSILLSVSAMVIYLVWLYQTWDAVPPEHRRTTPGKAVGFLFIPFFNLYWIFVAVTGLSRSMQEALRSEDAHAGAGFGIGVAACVSAVIPYVNCFSWILFLIWVNVANSAKNRMLSSPAT